MDSKRHTKNTATPRTAHTEISFLKWIRSLVICISHKLFRHIHALEHTKRNTRNASDNNVLKFYDLCVFLHTYNRNRHTYHTPFGHLLICSLFLSICRWYSLSLYLILSNRDDWKCSVFKLCVCVFSALIQSQIHRLWNRQKKQKIHHSIHEIDVVCVVDGVCCVVFLLAAERVAVICLYYSPVQMKNDQFSGEIKYSFCVGRCQV